MYRLFIRNWYRYERLPKHDFMGRPIPGKYYREIVPGPGPKQRVPGEWTITQARAECEHYNRAHNPGPLSRKMEFKAI